MTFNEEVAATRKDTRKYEGRDMLAAVARLEKAQKAWRGSVIIKEEDSDA